MNTDGQLVGESIRSILDEFKIRLLLIASSPRGGSTFACELVGAHQEIFFVPWNDKAIYNREAYKREPDIVFRQRLLREPLYFDSDRLRNILGLQKFSQLSVIIDQACHHRRIDELICLQGMIYWLLDESRLPLTKMRYWVIKTNTFRSLDELLKLLPDARCVVVQRDPRSVSLSLAKVRANRARFDDTHLIAAAVDWTRQATKFAKLMQKYKNRVSLVRYEKLVIDAESSLNMLYGLLRLNPIDSNILNQVVSRLAYKTTRSNYDRFEVSSGSGSALCGIQTGGLERWRSQLSPGQISAVSSVTQIFGSLFGYEMRVRESGTMAILRGPARELARRLYQLCRWLFTRGELLTIQRSSTSI